MVNSEAFFRNDITGDEPSDPICESNPIHNSTHEPAGDGEAPAYYAAAIDDNAEEDALIGESKDNARRVDQDPTKLPLLKMCVSVFLHITACFCVLPSVTPLVVDGVYGGDIEKGSRFIAYMQFASAFIEVITMPLIGSLSDTYGRRKFLLLAVSGFSSAFLIVGLHPSLTTIIVANTIRSLVGAFIVITSAVVVDIGKDAVNDKTFLTRSFATIFAFAMAAEIVGSGMGALLGKNSPIYPFLTSACLEAANFLWIVMLLPETLHEGIPLDILAANPWSAFKVLLQTRSRSVLMCIVCLVTLASTAFSQLFVWLKYRYNWNAFRAGLFLMFIGIMGIVNIGLGVFWFIPKYGETKTIIVALCCGICLFISMAFTSAGWQLYILIGLFSFAAVGFPAKRGLLSKQIPRDVQGKVQGTVGSCSTLINGVGPLIASLVFSYSVDNLSNGKNDSFDPGSGLLFFCFVPFYVIALLLVCCTLPDDVEVDPYATSNDDEQTKTQEEEDGRVTSKHAV